MVPIFKRRACIMKVLPTFLKGAYRSAMRLALSEAEAAHRAGRGRISRAWKLFLLLPRILLHRPPRGGKLPRASCWSGSQSFLDGELTGLKLWCAWGSCPQADKAMRGRCVSCVIQSGDHHSCAPLFQKICRLHSQSFLSSWIRACFLKNLKSARRGAAGGSSGMIAEHLRLLLDSEADCHKEVFTAVRMGRITALQKPSGGISGASWWEIW